MLFWNTWEKRHDFGLEMPSENWSHSFKDNCWCRTSLSISKQSHGTGVLKLGPEVFEGHAQCCCSEKLCKGHRNWSVSREWNLSQIVSNVFCLTGKSLKRIQIIGRKSFPCRTRCAAPFRIPRGVSMSSVLVFSILLEYHVSWPWIYLCDFLKWDNLDSNLPFLPSLNSIFYIF